MADLKINKDLLLSSAITPDYTRLEYIQTTGTQYIDTEFDMDAQVKIEMDIALTSGSGDQKFFGNYDGTQFGVCIGTLNNKWRFGDYTWTNNDGTTTTDRITITCVNNSFTFGGTTYTSTRAVSGYYGRQLVIGAIIYQYAILEYANMKIYGLKLYKQRGNVLIRDMVPAKRNSDGAIGMYDKRCNKFFTNAGTGEFVTGTELGPVGIEDTAPRVKNMEGNLRLVAWGVTDTVGISATTWSNRGLNSGVIIFDDRWAYTTNGKNLYTKQQANYFIAWQWRPTNNNGSMGCGIRFNSEAMGDSKFFRWGAAAKRDMIYGFEGAVLSENTNISAVVYCDNADTLRPMNVWLFVRDEGV